MFDFYPTCLEKTKHIGIFTPGCYFPHMFGFWHIGMGKGTHVCKKPHNYMFANVWHFPHMCGKSHWHAYFPLSYGWGEAASFSAKKKKKTPSTLRRNVRKREDFLQKKLASPAQVSEKGTEALQKAPTSLHHHLSPPPSSGRRQVITVGKRTVPSFNRLDGADSPPAGGEEFADLVLPHYHGDNMTSKRLSRV